VWLHWNAAPLRFATSVAEVPDELLACVELCARWLVSIEIAYQTNPERDVVEIVAVHMTAVDLAAPAIADFDLAIAGRCAVPNHEVIGKAVLHPPNMLVVIIKDTRIALPGATVVDNNKLPATPFYWRTPDSIDH
jgi:hypothetical protein